MFELMSRSIFICIRFSFTMVSRRNNEESEWKVKSGTKWNEKSTEHCRLFGNHVPKFNANILFRIDLEMVMWVLFPSATGTYHTFNWNVLQINVWTGPNVHSIVIFYFFFFHSIYSILCCLGCIKSANCREQYVSVSAYSGV